MGLLLVTCICVHMGRRQARAVCAVAAAQAPVHACTNVACLHSAHLIMPSVESFPVEHICEWSCGRGVQRTSLLSKDIGGTLHCPSMYRVINNVIIVYYNAALLHYAACSILHQILRVPHVLQPPWWLQHRPASVKSILQVLKLNQSK